MAISTEALRGNLRLSYGDDVTNYTVSGLDAEADAGSLLLLAEAVGILQGEEPLDLINRSEFRLFPE